MLNFVVGDIHGCVDEFCDLLLRIHHKAQFENVKEVKVWSLGDELDRGPDSEAVCALVFDNEGHLTMESTEVQILSIQSNHSEKFVRWARHQEVQREGGKANPMKMKPEWPNLLRFAANFESLPMWRRPDSGELLVHGGIEPAMKGLCSSDFYKCSKVDKNILRTRYVNPQGRMVYLGDEKPEDRFWSEVYDGRFGKVLYGHQPFDTVRYDSFAVGLDNGVVFGGTLTALCIETDELIQVKAKRQYAEHYSKESE